MVLVVLTGRHQRALGTSAIGNYGALHLLRFAFEVFKAFLLQQVPQLLARQDVLLREQLPLFFVKLEVDAGPWHVEQRFQIGDFVRSQFYLVEVELVIHFVVFLGLEFWQGNLSAG